ncbi:MAG: DUF2064 domain-containing protein [Candidatus Zixiibacteriota bacterium]
MPTKDVVIVQMRNPPGKEEPFPVLRVFDDAQMLKLKRAFFEDTIRQVAEVRGVDIKLAVAPPARLSWAQDAIENLTARYNGHATYKSLAARTEIVPQAVGPLEERTAENMQRCFDEGYERVVLVGGFTPTLDPQRIIDAFKHLRSHPLILGPTIEGGCYLIGLRSDCREAIGLVSVGSDVAYKRSTSALTEAGITWQEIDLSYDVGHQEDLEFIVREINHCRYTGDEDTALNTERVLAQFINESPAEDPASN